MIQKIFRIFAFISVGVMGLFVVNLKSTAADTTNPDIIIAQIKVTTNSQFVALYNNTAQPIDMGSISLQYFNNYQLSAVTSTKSIQLSGTLAAHSYYMVNDGPINLCYQTMVQSASLSFSTKAGLVEVLRLTQQSGSSINMMMQDFVGWSSSAVAGAQTMPTDPSFLQRQQVNNKPIAGSWIQVKPAASNPCNLVTTIAPNSPVPNTNIELLPPTPPPASIVSVIGDSTNSSKLPSSDAGLMAPQLNELLPNPASPQTDEKDEFIELYNPNDSVFDLEGFKLQTASSVDSTKHTYTFPGGTKIAAKSFAAYPSSNITVSLTNSGGLAWLLDPNDKVISQTEQYSTAKDGQAWALADGKWYWTNKPTPGAANVISAGSQVATNNGGTGTVKGVATSNSSMSKSSPSDSSSNKPRSLNSTILVGVGLLAVVYGLYEYRRDLANWIHKLQRNRATRRENRPKT